MGRLPEILTALARPADDPAVRGVVDAFGGDPVSVRERSVGAPAYRSRRLLFASGGEIILHDDTVVAVVLHVAATPTVPRGIDLSAWIPGVDGTATLDDLATALGSRPRFAGLKEPYFTLDGGHVRTVFAEPGDWRIPGNLISATFTVDQPGLACRPEDDDCPTCSDLLVRGEDDEVDVARTVDALSAALSAGLLTQDAQWIALSDLLALQASGLMEWVESQLTCVTCRRIICLTLFRDSTATFGHHVLNDARRRPLEAVPPVEQWGDADRIAQDRDAMHHVDHERGSWFLVERHGVLHLEARYAVSSMVDDSALVRLDASELAAYADSGHAYLSELAQSIGKDASRDLYRGPDGAHHRAAVRAAIVNHTWLAEQRQAAAQRSLELRSRDGS